MKELVFVTGSRPICFPLTAIAKVKKISAAALVNCILLSKRLYFSSTAQNLLLLYNCACLGAQQPPVAHGLLIHRICRSQTTSRHSR